MVETLTNSSGSKPLIPRKALFGNPDRVSPQLSPDGKRLSFLAPVNGVLHSWSYNNDCLLNRLNGRQTPPPALLKEWESFLRREK